MSQSQAPWPSSQLLNWATAHCDRYRIVDLKAALSKIGASRGTSTLPKGGLFARLTQELQGRTRAVARRRWCGGEGRMAAAIRRVAGTLFAATHA